MASQSCSATGDEAPGTNQRHQPMYGCGQSIPFVPACPRPASPSCLPTTAERHRCGSVVTRYGFSALASTGASQVDQQVANYGKRRFRLELESREP